MSLKRKWVVVGIISSGALCVTSCSSMVAACYDGIQADVSFAY